jgi:ABC-type multidrug transport system fused ATPase/permease subunit
MEASNAVVPWNPAAWTICYLPRDPVLFDGTISSNLLFVRPGASDREVPTALHLADLDNLARPF